MVDPAFSHLRRKLLEGGIAPRRVHRLLQELRDHHASLLLEQQRTGLVDAAAAEAALAQLGTEESLAKQLLARSELLSWSRRWPWAIYALAPLLLFPAAMICVLLAVHPFLPQMRHASVATFQVLMHTIRLFELYFVPVLAGAGTALLARRRGLSAAWSWLSLTLFALLGSFADIEINGYHVVFGYGFPGRLKLIAPLVLDRWLPTAAAAVGLYVIGLFWARRTVRDTSLRT